ncbi:hypothetical protein NQ314_009641 [Rhamnusium bicolor]|uniref:Uncharacterized protein n=1 Tax=Rhamnusium bicolor TaxID=1586634 RepID=A0AAV8XZF8_9CUCU|nr:hypothetical protein NQ314_009641 [Rhamnusium bicolor]
MGIEAKVMNHDGTPAKFDKPELIVRHGYSRVDEVYEVNMHKLNQNGIVKLEYVTPVNVTNTTALRIEVNSFHITHLQIKFSQLKNESRES